MPSRLITSDEVLAEASSIIKDASEQEKVFMRQWIYRAQREIGFSHFDIKVSEPITVVDYSAAKPDDFVKAIDVALFDSTGNEIITRYKGWGKRQDLLPEGGLARTRQDVRLQVNAINISEDQDYFHTGVFAQGEDDTAYMVMKYYALPIDSATNLPLIPESNTLAIMMYIRWMWMMRQNENQSSIDIARDVWLRERARASSRNNTPSQLEGGEIARKINSMIQKVIVTDRQF